jgi:hypothetical protein
MAHDDLTMTSHVRHTRAATKAHAENMSTSRTHEDANHPASTDWLLVLMILVAVVGATFIR